MNEPGKSDKPVVPSMPAKFGFWDLYRQRVERAEGRGLAKENEEQGDAAELLPNGKTTGKRDSHEKSASACPLDKRLAAEFANLIRPRQLS